MGHLGLLVFSLKFSDHLFNQEFEVVLELRDLLLLALIQLLSHSRLVLKIKLNGVTCADICLTLKNLGSFRKLLVLDHFWALQGRLLSLLSNAILAQVQDVRRCNLALFHSSFGQSLFMSLCRWCPIDQIGFLFSDGR